MQTETEGLKKLRSWIAADEKRNQSALADELKIKQPSVSAWLRGVARPDAHLRTMLEHLTGIPATDWFTDEERAQIRGARAKGRRQGRAKGRRAPAAA